MRDTGRVVSFVTEATDRASSAAWVRLQPHLELLKFRLHHCDNKAHVILSPEPFQATHPNAIDVMFEPIEDVIELSRDISASSVEPYFAPQLVAFRKTDGTILVQKTFTNFDLCATPPAEFWLSWTGGVLELGLGKPHGDKLLTWNSTLSTLPVEALCFQADHTGQLWELTWDQGGLIID